MGCSGLIQPRAQKPEGSPESNPSCSAQSLCPNTWRNSQPCRGQRAKGVWGCVIQVTLTSGTWSFKSELTIFFSKFSHSMCLNTSVLNSQFHNVANVLEKGNDQHVPDFLKKKKKSCKHKVCPVTYNGSTWNPFIKSVSTLLKCSHIKTNLRVF